ncbi:MAG: penicillin-binding protein, partial [Nocardioidaceae bacterium]|nr:penicillin-binding protein [Nocardioidaceae bacterium]
YYSDGKHKIGTFLTQNRESISINEMPDSIQNAVIAAEDRSFYTNRGIDIKGIIRAARNNATSDSTQGASTITQQYVKILYLTQERSITRKAKEAILSLKIHNQLTKKEILEGYLNTIYFGNGAYGIEAAAQTYFRVPASELTLAQSAALAVIINNPSANDPYSESGPGNMIGRYQYVLNGMVSMGAVTQAEASAVKGELPTFAKKVTTNRFGGTKGFLLSTTERYMRQVGFTDSQINGGGLKIVTTFDYKDQKAAVAAVKEERPDGLKELHVGIAAVEPGTGALRAMYGGPDYLKSQLNWAMLGAQPGSTFKAFAVAAALEDGYSLKTKLDGDSPYEFPNGDKVANQGDSGGKSYGSLDLLNATKHSVNTAFMDLTEQMDDGPEKVKAAALAAGIPQKTLDGFGEDIPVTSLGFAPVSPVNMANGYATFAAEGKTAEVYVIQKVTEPGGSTAYQHKKETKQGFPKDVAADVSYALQQVVKSGGTGTNGATQCATAGKTGTATFTDPKGGSDYVSSSWFVGFTPRLATAVSYSRGKNGNGRLDGYMPTFFGGQYPARTFANFMRAATAGKSCEAFPPPANIKADKGTEYKPKPKTPKCGADERLNKKKTKCVPVPTPTPTPTPIPTPTPTPTPTPPPTTSPTPSPSPPAPTCTPPKTGVPPNCV